MKFEFFISSTAITVVASLVSAIVSALIAKRTAENTANKEIEKMRLSWEREDMVSSDEEFAEMASLVSKFVSFANGAWSCDAIEKVTAIRSKESAKMGIILDELYKSIMNGDYTQTDALLTQAINEKRRIKSSEPEC